jgi:LruC domain-containing protein
MAGQHIRIANTGQYPTGIVIPYNWSWPTERTSICDAYKQFKAWAEDVSHSTNPDWYKNPERKLVTK